MPAAPRTVTGNVATLTGEARAGIKAIFTRKLDGDVFAQYGEVVVNEPVEAWSGPGGVLGTKDPVTGEWSAGIPLLPGGYDLLWSGSNGPKRCGYTLHEDGSTDLVDGIPQASQVPLTPSLVAQAADYRDEALAARDAAVVARTGAETAEDGAQAAQAAAEAARDLADADATATAADRVQTGLDRAATGQDRIATGLDAAATAADRAAIETSLLVYVADDADSLTIAAGQTMVVAEGTSPYPTVTLEFATP
jgi:hypothetical protein